MGCIYYEICKSSFRVVDVRIFQRSGCRRSYLSTMGCRHLIVNVWGFDVQKFVVHGVDNQLSIIGYRPLCVNIWLSTFGCLRLWFSKSKRSTSAVSTISCRHLVSTFGVVIQTLSHCNLSKLVFWKLDFLFWYSPTIFIFNFFQCER